MGERKCVHCRKANPPTSKVCLGCGEPLPQEEAGYLTSMGTHSKHFRMVDLKGLHLKEAPVKVLRAEVPANSRVPFAIVFYAVKGHEEKLGLRLDVDKRVFLDHLEDQSQEKAIVALAPEVAKALAQEMYEGSRRPR